MSDLSSLAIPKPSIFLAPTTFSAGVCAAFSGLSKEQAHFIAANQCGRSCISGSFPFPSALLPVRPLVCSSSATSSFFPV